MPAMPHIRPTPATPLRRAAPAASRLRASARYSARSVSDCTCQLNRSRAKRSALRRPCGKQIGVLDESPYRLGQSLRLRGAVERAGLRLPQHRADIGQLIRQHHQPGVQILRQLVRAAQPIIEDRRLVGDHADIGLGGGSDQFVLLDGIEKINAAAQQPEAAGALDRFLPPDIVGAAQEQCGATGIDAGPPVDQLVNAATRREAALKQELDPAASEIVDLARSRPCRAPVHPRLGIRHRINAVESIGPRSSPRQAAG